MKKVNILVCILLSISLVTTVLLPSIKMYREDFDSERYLSFEDSEVSYDTLFFTPSEIGKYLYGIGLQDKWSIESDDIIQDYGAAFPKFTNCSLETIDYLYSILKKCTYIPVQKDEAYRLCLRFNRVRSITSPRLSTVPVFKLRSSYDEYYSQALVDELVKEKIGAYLSGIYKFKSKIYIWINFANYIDSPHDNADVLDFYECFDDTYISVFQIKPSEALDELLENKQRFKTGFKDTTIVSPIKYAVLGKEVLCIGLLWLIIFILKKRSKMRKSKTNKALKT